MRLVLCSNFLYMVSPHIPVLLEEVLRTLAPAPGERVLDCTLGLGGHAAAFLSSIGQQGEYIGIEADATNLSSARKNLRPWYGQCTLYHTNFRDIPSLLLPQVEIVFADLGLSSPHLDNPERGFSFRYDAPLDMRFDASYGEPASVMIKGASAEELTRVFSVYGELERSKTLASMVLQSSPKTTQDLRRIVEQCYVWRAPRVLPQVFQALRIWVNDECGALEQLLLFAPTLLKPGGRMGIMSYHSLEDRAVKHIFRTLCTPCRDPLTGAIATPAPFMRLTKKPVRPSASEQEHNPRSRSARFRAIRRIA